MQPREQPLRAWRQTRAGRRVAGELGGGRGRERALGPLRREIQAGAGEHAVRHVFHVMARVLAGLRALQYM